MAGSDQGLPKPLVALDPRRHEKRFNEGAEGDQLISGIIKFTRFLSVYELSTTWDVSSELLPCKQLGRLDLS